MTDDTDYLGVVHILRNQLRGGGGGGFQMITLVEFRYNSYV